ncbi:DBF4-type zinc finger-containing protein 2 homolog [Orussus abietinus]|uniref:DBF4-type zinc finger-containing protein 2 homolog n=1 Tax=Orussus abietinus TaxID=222816 RepID=UPI0006267648|nr:DBF4-type zinc finger-containing protein 2 homolog [Orussus abietinus]
MPCDGKNPNCQRRRELLAQLKCLVSSMDRKKPCEWDESTSSAPVCFPACPPADDPCCIPPRACKSFELRGGAMYRCECIKRNGLQDRCTMFDCMGRPECTTKLYPVCGPGRAALLGLTDLGDAEVALRKYRCADEAREAALAAYCRLKCRNSCGPPPPRCPKFPEPSWPPCPPPELVIGPPPCCPLPRARCTPCLVYARCPTPWCSVPNPPPCCPVPC